MQKGGELPNKIKPSHERTFKEMRNVEARKEYRLKIQGLGWDEYHF